MWAARTCLFMMITELTHGCQCSLCQQLNVLTKTTNTLALTSFFCTSHCFWQGLTCMSLLSLTCIDSLSALLYWLVSGWFDIRWPGSLSDLLCPKIVLALCLCQKCYHDRCVWHAMSAWSQCLQKQNFQHLYTQSYFTYTYVCLNPPLLHTHSHLHRLVRTSGHCLM